LRLEEKKQTIPSNKFRNQNNPSLNIAYQRE